MVSRQIKYEWDYLYGSLDVIGGQALFCQIPAVNQRSDHAISQIWQSLDRDEKLAGNWWEIFTEQDRPGHGGRRRRCWYR